MLILLFDAIGHMSSTGDSPLPHVMYVLSAILQMLAILILVMCVGGLSARDLAGEFAESIDTIRHGDQKSVLVPLKGEQPMPREPRATPRQTITLNEDDDAIPLE